MAPRNVNAVGNDDYYWRFLDGGLGLSLPSQTTASNAAMKDDLRRGGYTFPSIAKRADIAELRKRIWRVLPNYARCTPDQLWKFNLDRGTVSKLENRNRSLHTKLLISRLRDADASPAFTKFLDLPPELRCRVYDCYTKEFPVTLQHPTQPPFARINSVIRKELLPIFYRSAKFKIEFVRDQKDPSKPTWLRLEQASHAWIGSLSAASLGEIQDWTIRDDSFQWIYGIHFTGDAAETSISFFDHPAETSINLFAHPRSVFDWHMRPLRNESAEATKQILDKVALREGRVKLRLEDIYAIRRKWEEIAYPATHQH